METPLLPRKLFFDNPDRAMLRLSPDGRYMSYLAPYQGVLNVWLAPRDAPQDATVLTHDTGRGIQHYLWAHTNRHLLYLQDKGGDENWRLYRVTLETHEVTDLTPFDGVQARPYDPSPQCPETVLVGLNNRDPKWHDLYQLNVVSGELTLIEENHRFVTFVADAKQKPRLAAALRPDGGSDLYIKAADGWQLWDRIPSEDDNTSGPVAITPEGDAVYVVDSRERNCSALFRIALATRAKTLLAEDARADVADVVRHPQTGRVQAVGFTYERTNWTVIDPELQADFEVLGKLESGDVSIASRSTNDDYWVVAYTRDVGPIAYYLYHRPSRQATYLFSSRSALEGQPLAPMHPFRMTARDGLMLVGYYTLPLGSDSDGDGIPDQPLPMVFTPHGGPWWRDSWGYNPWHQWLANRGYAVMTINFRASTGFGKALVNAGDREWGGKIIDDQCDAVDVMIARGIADKQRIAIMGGSFGGYSVLAGLTFHPERYACGIDLVGVSNLETFLGAIPPYWQTMRAMLHQRVGDPTTEEGRALLQRHSPIHYVERICRPLLIAQGANDPRVVKAESDQIVAAMQEKGLPVTYLLYPDEGHGFVRPENNLSFYAIAEAFLEQVLGGRLEPIGDDLTGSSLQVLAGAEHVAGLSEALKRQAAQG